MPPTPVPPIQSTHNGYPATPTPTQPSAPDAAVGTLAPLLRLAISRPHATVAVVHVAGEIDASTAPELRALLNTPPVQTVRHMLLDLSGVTFLSAAGLSVLIAAQRRADTLRHALSLVIGPHCVDRALQITGLQDQFTC